MYKNQAILEGFLGQKPEIRYLASGDKVANAKLATKEFWRDSSGKVAEATEWHALVFYADRAERAQLYDKGDNLHVEGKIQTRRYTNSEGQQKAVREIVVMRSHRIDRMQDERERIGEPPTDAAPESSAAARAATPAEDANMPEL